MKGGAAQLDGSECGESSGFRCAVRLRLRGPFSERNRPSEGDPPSDTELPERRLCSGERSTAAGLVEGGDIQIAEGEGRRGSVGGVFIRPLTRWVASSSLERVLVAGGLNMAAAAWGWDNCSADKFWRLNSPEKYLIIIASTKSTLIFLRQKSIRRKFSRHLIYQKYNVKVKRSIKDLSIRSSCSVNTAKLKHLFVLLWA